MTAQTVHLVTREWEVLVVGEHAEAVAFLRSAHYAKGASNTSTYRHGLYPITDLWPFRAPLAGVAMWMPPTRVTAESVALRGDWEGVLCLSRLAVAEGVPTNGASFLLGRSMRMIDRRRWPVLLTYADTAEGHTGAIYKATNWTCLGEVDAGDTWTTPDGVMRGRKRGGRTLTRAEMVAAGCVQRPCAPKIKYVHYSRAAAMRIKDSIRRTSWM